MTIRWMPAAALALTVGLCGPAWAHGDHHGQGGQPDACCAPEGGQSCEGMACCEAGCAEQHQGGMHGRMHGHMFAMRHALRKNAELRYNPPMANGNQFLVLGMGPSARLNDWFSLGFQHNLAVQLFPAGPAGNWVVPYAGGLPKLGVSLGAARLEAGALVGLGTMLRTAGATGGAGDSLQARFMWVVEPRVELGWKGDGWGAGLVGTYMLNPNMSEFGGATVGLNVSARLPRW